MQIVADNATNAAVGQADGLAFHRDHQLGVDVDLTEIVHQHRESFAARIVDDMVQQGSLTGPQKATDDC
jgi:hypothetical protein